MTRYIVDRYGWQEACNGIMCSECQFRDGHGNCKIGLYIRSQPVYEEEKPKETDETLVTYEENVRAILESNFAGFKEEVIDIACKMILGLRTYGEWIPCDEQLPKEDDETQVLVSVNERYRFYNIILLPSKSVKTEYRLGHIDAWMELPEAYEKEEIQKTYSTKLECIGFSQHDCESHYKCPFCGEQYGSWSIPINKPFKCKCGKYVWTD